MSHVTENLRRYNEGDTSALDDLLPHLYQDLKRLAASRRAGAGQTLTATALVHETYLRLLRQRRLGAADRGEFFAVAAVTMRRILIDHARAKARDKRGGGRDHLRLTDAEALLGTRESEEFLELDDALCRLEERSARSARVVELRFFAGLSVEEIADHLEVTVRTVHRDWVAARAWLRTQIGAERVEASDPQTPDSRAALASPVADSGPWPQS